MPGTGQCQVCEDMEALEATSCPACDDTGRCPTCGGTGICPDCDGEGTHLRGRVCMTCGGDAACAYC